MVGALVLLLGGTGQANASVAAPVCVNNTVQYPASLPAGAYSDELSAAFRAICSAPNSNLVGLIKNAGAAETALGASGAEVAASASGELLAVRTAVGVLPALGTLGAIAGGVAAFDVGWKIGRGIDTKWLHLTKNEPTIAPSSVTVKWYYVNPYSILDLVTQYWCSQYVPASRGCDYGPYGPAGAPSHPDFSGWSKVAPDGADSPPARVWVLGVPNASSHRDNLWPAGAGLSECAILSPNPCAQSVLDYRSALASSIPRADIETLRSDQPQNDGWVAPNTDPPSWGFFALRTDQQMAKHVRASLSDYAGQTPTQTTNITLPADDTIADRARSELLRPGNEDAARVIGNELDPDNVAPVTQLHMPSCAGLDYWGCLNRLRASGLVGNVTRATLDFTHAVITAGPGGVVKTSPKVGTVLDVGDDVTVYVNPGAAGMPVLVPSIDVGVSLEEAAQLLQAQQLNPVFDVAATPNPSYGPDTVISSQTDPAAHTRAHPGDDVRVRVNPSDAPVPSSPGLFTPPTIPPVQVPNVPTPCNVFPFGVPCWVVAQLGALSAPPVAPQFTVRLPFEQRLHIDFSNVAGYDLGEVMVIVRPVILFIATLGALVWLGRAAMTGNPAPPGGADGDD